MAVLRYNVNKLIPTVESTEKTFKESLVVHAGGHDNWDESEDDQTQLHLEVLWWVWSVIVQLSNTL